MITRLALSIVALLGACQHQNAPVPAILADGSDSNRAALEAGLAAAMDQAQIELGAGDPTQTSSVAVLPPRPTSVEANSPAMPTVFDLFVRNGDCFAVRRGTGAETPLPGVTCRPLLDIEPN